MFGYPETRRPILMPRRSSDAHRFCADLGSRHSGARRCWARTPEQVTVQYEKASRSRARDRGQHQHLVEDMTSDRSGTRRAYVREALPKDWIHGKTMLAHQPTGKSISASRRRLRIDRPQIIVDTYGGAALMAAARSPQGSTKVDRSPAYAARYVARMSSPRLADRCTLRSLTPSAWRGRCDLYRHPRHREGTEDSSRGGGRSDGPTPRGIRKHLT